MTKVSGKTQAKAPGKAAAGKDQARSKAPSAPAVSSKAAAATAQKPAPRAKPDNAKATGSKSPATAKVPASPAKVVKAVKAPGERKTPSGATRTAAPELLDTKVVEPRRVIEGYSKDERFLATQRAALLRERSTYLEQAASLKAEAESLVEEMEPGDIQFDDESGEGGTVTVDRERDLALSAQALAAVEEIDHTLAKMDNGTYGICENCGKLIVKARLEALPYARLCIDCKSGGLSRR
jgi:DnaK suppressor protein